MLYAVAGLTIVALLIITVLAAIEHESRGTQIEQLKAEIDVLDKIVLQLDKDKEELFQHLLNSYAKKDGEEK